MTRVKEWLRPRGEPAHSGPISSSLAVKEWFKSRVENEGYWFHRIELAPDLITPGWSDPKRDKLPYYGLPDDMHGMRVLDIGTAEGFFSFEAERRGASEVVGIDSHPDGVRRFNICRDALGSRATAYLCNVYDLSARSFGTFDMVFFFGVLYHLRHPLLALEKILEVCTGTMLMQTATYEVPGAESIPLAKFHPFGMPSGPDPEGKPLFDPTVFWMPNGECTKALLLSAGFQDVQVVSTESSIGIALRAQGQTQAAGKPPDETKAPWS
jgi:tRNA (mo5U34)-methyltransferase